jgi:hypothetical protein
VSIDSKLIESFFSSIIHVPGYCAEVRLPNARIDFSTRCIDRCPADSKYPSTVAGWFDRPDELSCELSRVTDASVYITVNPVTLANRPPDAHNTLKQLKRGQFVTDSDISFIRYMIIDIDPPRIQNSKINSTEEELKNCLLVRDSIISDQNLQGFCVTGCSGNGAFILVRVPDLPNDDDSLRDVSAFLTYISSKYTSDKCVVDAQTQNPSRMVGVPGTLKCRDSVSTPTRPYRRVTVEVSHGSPATVEPPWMD